MEGKGGGPHRDGRTDHRRMRHFQSYLHIIIIAVVVVVAFCFSSPLSPPYSDVKTNLAVGCESEA